MHWRALQHPRFEFHAFLRNREACLQELGQLLLCRYREVRGEHISSQLQRDYQLELWGRITRSLEDVPFNSTVPPTRYCDEGDTLRCREFFLLLVSQLYLIKRTRVVFCRQIMMPFLIRWRRGRASVLRLWLGENVVPGIRRQDSERVCTDRFLNSVQSQGWLAARFFWHSRRVLRPWYWYQYNYYLYSIYIYVLTGKMDSMALSNLRCSLYLPFVINILSSSKPGYLFSNTVAIFCFVIELGNPICTKSDRFTEYQSSGLKWCWVKKEIRSLNAIFKVC